MLRRYGSSCHGYICLALLALIGRRAKPEVTSGEEPGLKDYCLTDLFEAGCPENQVVLMQIGRYGRMRMGSCVRTDFGFLGCHTDVIEIMDLRCSGRRKCSLRVPDPLFEKFAGAKCNPEFKSYLAASFTCVPVVSSKEFQCSSAQQLRLTAPAGYIPSLLQPSDGTGACRSDHLPWLIEVETGKKILFTLYDFGLIEAQHGTGSFVSANGCIQYADIVEVGNSQMHRVCGGRARKADVYTSVTNAVQVRIARKEQLREKQMSKSNDGHNHVYFLIHYQAIGCSDPELPANVWFKRSGDQATVGCAFGERQWQIQCSKNDWIGSIGNCSQEALSYGSDQGMTSGSLLSLPFEVSLAIIVGLAFVVGVTVFTLGVILLKRNNFHSDRLAESQRVALADRTRGGSVTGFGVCLDRGGTLTSPSKYGHSLLDDNRPQGPGSCPGGESDYAYVWDNPAEAGGEPVQGHIDPAMHYLHPMCQIVARMPPGGVYETTVNHPDKTAHSKMDLFDDGRVVMMNRVEHLA